MKLRMAFWFAAPAPIFIVGKDMQNFQVLVLLKQMLKANPF